MLAHHVYYYSRVSYRGGGREGGFKYDYFVLLLQATKTKRWDFDKKN